MIANQFEMVLKEFEAIFNCPLKPDENQSCLIQLNNGIQIQIEQDRHDDSYIVMGTKLGMLPPGRYRENILKEALKANYLHPQIKGVFGFGPKSGSLILFTRIKIQNINAEMVQNFLPAFIEKAGTWSEAINRGNIPQVSEASMMQAKPGLFGLMH